MQVMAAVLRDPHGEFVLEELTLEETPRSDEVLVRMVATGMCHSDLLGRDVPHFYPGPVVYGHEGAGVVELVGDAVTKVQPGDHVVLSFWHCGTCRWCTSGHPAHCAHMSELNVAGRRPDGSRAWRDSQGEPVGSHFFGQSSFATHSMVAQASVVRVDHSYDLATLGPLGCGVQTGAGAVLNCLKVRPEDSLVVLGVGAVGLSAVMAATVAGVSDVIVIDRFPGRLELGRRFGATHTVQASSADEVTTAIMDLTGFGADAVFDTTGQAALVEAGYAGLNRNGTLAACGIGAGEVRLPMARLVSGRRIIGVSAGDARPNEFIPYLAELNAAGRLPFHELEQRYPLAAINLAEKAMRAGEVVKPVLTFG
jgi:aryl-alcohol dehydrogenase